MKITTIKSIKGDLSQCHLPQDDIISTTSEFLSVIMSCNTKTIIIKKENLSAEFYNLKTGIAGEYLQKISNYNKQIIILGNFDNIESKALNDFIYESNKNGTVIFIDEIDKAIKLLKK